MEKKYIVKPEEKLVVAMVDVKSESVNGTDDEIEMYCSNNTQELLAGLLIFDRVDRCPQLDIAKNAEFKSIAKCDDFDSFDEKIGKEIAGCKVDVKYHRSMVKKYEMIMDILDRAAVEINKLLDKHETKATNIERSIEKYIKGRCS